MGNAAPSAERGRIVLAGRQARFSAALAERVQLPHFVTTGVLHALVGDQ